MPSTGALVEIAIGPKTPKPHVIAILKKIYREIYNNYSDLIYNIFVLMVG